MMRPLRLVPSGVQAWHRECIAASGEHFAYSSTMALHIFRQKDNTLHKMIAAHDRAICAICWCPTDGNLLASCSEGGGVAIWDIEAEEERYSCKGPEGKILLDWAQVGDRIALCRESGDVKVWQYREDKFDNAFSLSGTAGTALRWHPRVPAKLLLGTSSGAIEVFDQQTGKKVEIAGKSKTSKDAVTDAQWDPLSDDYLLAAFKDGTLVLFDAASQREIHSFDRQSQGISFIAWARAQPGNFVTCSERVGLLKIWNVSQKAPLAQVKVGSAGVTCVKAIPSEPTWFLLAFNRGSVGVCDIAQRSMRFMTAPGHSETIFDCVFHPQDPDVLGTASYDGHVKLWRISTGDSIRDMFAGTGVVLYGLAFGPGATRVCAVTSTGMLIVWRTDTGEQVLKQQLHSGQAYRCEWNQKGRSDGTGEIATGGADKIACVVDGATGNVLAKLSHPGSVVGVAWHSSLDGILATACKDAKIRIFNLAQVAGDAQPQAVIAGHDARVFNLAWHPVCPGIIASGSDDKTIRIWSWPQAHGKSASASELRRLTGHSSYVRGLLWHPELPNILFSGSWDSTIRVWDVATGRALHVCREHLADVYGIALHPQRPFFLASSSRDTTLRFWIFEDLVRPLLVRALVDPGALDQLLGNGAAEVEELLAQPACAAQKLPTRLYGAAGRELAGAVGALLAMKGKQPSLQAYRKIITFFMYRPGIDCLWGLLAAIRGERLPKTPGMPEPSVFHERELIACQKSKALELASSRGGMGIALKQEERLLKAAQMMLRIGDLQSYCRLTAQAGQWERAISIAPAVSHQFWRQLTSEYIDTLSASTDLEEAAPFWVAVGQSSRLIDTYIERGELDQAFVVAKADCEGHMPSATQALPAQEAAAGAEGEARSRLEDVAAVLASRYSQLGEPVQAAMCFLAVSATQRAVSALMRSQEDGSEQLAIAGTVRDLGEEYGSQSGRGRGDGTARLYATSVVWLAMLVVLLCFCPTTCYLAEQLRASAQPRARDVAPPQPSSRFSSRLSSRFSSRLPSSSSSSSNDRFTRKRRAAAQDPAWLCPQLVVPARSALHCALQAAPSARRGHGGALLHTVRSCVDGTPLFRARVEGGSPAAAPGAVICLETLRGDQAFGSLATKEGLEPEMEITRACGAKFGSMRKDARGGYVVTNTAGAPVLSFDSLEHMLPAQEGSGDHDLHVHDLLAHDLHVHDASGAAMAAVKPGSEGNYEVRVNSNGDVGLVILGVLAIQRQQQIASALAERAR